MSLIRVFVVDDSLFMRTFLTDVITEHPKMKVVGTAGNGMEAIEKLTKIEADVITLDVEMPGLNGMQTLKKLEDEQKYEVIMLSNLTKSNADLTIEALQHGAFDFIPKPKSNDMAVLNQLKSQLQQTIYEAYIKQQRAQIMKESIVLQKKLKYLQTENNFIETKRVGQKNDYTHSGNSKNENTKVNLKPIKEKNETINHQNTDSKKKVVCNAMVGDPISLVVIGVSTGGPRALSEVLTFLPENFPCPIVIVQHMPKGFTTSLAARMNQISQINVKEVESNERLLAGVAYIAPGDEHVHIKNDGEFLLATLTNEPPLNGHRPSVDVLFQSVAKLQRCNVVAIVMTGMGRDGADGLEEMRKKQNVFAIAESEKTSIVYGMPKAVISKGLADEICDLHDIGEILLKQVVK